MLERKAEQYRKPHGLYGYYTSWVMERRNTATYKWALPLIKRQDNDKILEVGYGTGTGLNQIAKENKTVKLFGVDFSKVMFNSASRKNRGFINSGQMRLTCEDVLRYNSEKDFNVIYGLNVIYFWDDLQGYLSRIRDLLKQDGKLYLYMSSSERLDKLDFTRNDIFIKRPLKQVMDALTQTGFRNTGYMVNKTAIGDSYLISAQK
jgi:SAM-dependent methyltransferase